MLKMSVLEKLGYGGITAIIGMLIVFTGLVIIICCLKLMAAVFKKLDERKAEAAKSIEVAPVPAPAPVVEEEPEEEVTDDSELIAVIAAAIAAFDFGGKSVKIKSVRRVNGWKNAARTEQIYKF